MTAQGATLEIFTQIKILQAISIKYIVCSTSDLQTNDVKWISRLLLGMSSVHLGKVTYIYEKNKDMIRIFQILIGGPTLTGTHN